eukprot:585431-Karenia_brevis.AAC.1
MALQPRRPEVLRVRREGNVQRFDRSRAIMCEFEKIQRTKIAQSQTVIGAGSPGQSPKSC